jgi:hypothetical protein
MAVLRFKTGNVIVSDFPVGKNSGITKGCVLEFLTEEEIPSYATDEVPVWYKNVASRSFCVIDIVIKCSWENGGFSTGFSQKIEYIVEEL